MKQLMMGQLLYIEEHKRLPATNSLYYLNGGGISLSDSQVLARKQLFTWEGAWGLTISQKAKFVPSKGTIFKYTRDRSLYVCPSDHPGTATDTPLGGGGNGFLSYSMNAYIAWKKPEDLRAFTYRKQTTAQDTRNRTQTFNVGHRATWSTANLFVLVEEHPYYYINSGASGHGDGNFNVVDRIVTRHSPALGGNSASPGVKGRTNMAFLDGHAETRLYNWQTQATWLFADIGLPHDESDPAGNLRKGFMASYAETRDDPY
jgi:prepilin-type processing-associated H-X9-DG protein